MNKRYQVFVSSTYDDLKEERSKVVQALLNIDCIPCGMEYFPASDEDAWNCIERLIPKCDYYVVIIAGKYGSIPTGHEKSFTHREYELALEKKVPILCLLHKEPAKLPQERCETQPSRRKKLEAFRKQVSGRLCRFWSNADQLPAELLASLPHQIMLFPRVGWVRGDSIADDEAKTQIITLQQKLDKQAKQLQDYRERDRKTESEFASGSDQFVISGSYFMWGGKGADRIRHEVAIDAATTWDGLVKFIRDRVGIRWSKYDLEKKLISWLSILIPDEFEGDRNEKLAIGDVCLEAIPMQLNALGFIVRRASGWEFSAKGLEHASRLLAIKKGQSFGENSNVFQVTGEIYESTPDPEVLW